MANPHNPNNPIAVRHRSKGKLVAEHNRDFNKIQDICDLFGFQVQYSEFVRNGKTYFRYQGCEGAMPYTTKGVTNTDANITIEAGTGIEIWWPRNIEKLNGEWVEANPKEKYWINEIEQNDDLILECPEEKSKRKDHVKGFPEGDVFRVVIADYPRIGYSFLGVYKMDKEESQKLKRAVWRRISKEFVF